MGIEFPSGQRRSSVNEQSVPLLHSFPVWHKYNRGGRRLMHGLYTTDEFTRGGVNEMCSKSTHNRQRIVEAAEMLIYHQGYNQTSFSDIAQSAGLPRGNFYYYFKSKDEILLAVIAHRQELLQQQLEAWSRESIGPRDCLHRFVHMMQDEHGELLRYGCPIGSLTQELSKTQTGLRTQARALFELMQHWLSQQMTQLEVPDPLGTAMHLLGRCQGVTLIGCVYADQGFLEKEIEQLDEWIDCL
ncbi:TetR/AcrR family transcriptional regulator [Acidihalobacter prosperus]